MATNQNAIDAWREKYVTPVTGKSAVTGTETEKNVDNGLQTWRNKYVTPVTQKTVQPVYQEQSNVAASPSKGGGAVAASPAASSEAATEHSFLDRLAYGAGKVGTGILGALESANDFVGSNFYNIVGKTADFLDTPIIVFDEEKASKETFLDKVSEFSKEKAASYLENSITRDLNEKLDAKYKPTKGMQVAGAINETVSGLLPSLAVGNIAGAAGTGLKAAEQAAKGANVSKALFGLSAAGGAAGEAKSEGASTDQALTYGATAGLLESTIEGIAGGIPGMGGGKIGAITAKLTGNPAVAKILDIVGEGGEEALTTFVTPYLKRAMYDENAQNATAEEIAQSAAMGMIASGILQGGLELPGAIGNRIGTLPFDAKLAEENTKAKILPVEDPAAAGKGQKNTASTGETESTAVNTNPAQHTVAEQAIIEEYQSETDEALKGTFESYFNDPKQGFSRHNISTVSERQASDAAKLLGGEYKGYKNAINSNGIQHILNEHGPNGSVDNSLSDLNDIARMGYVLDNYDAVEVVTYESGESDLSREFRTQDNRPAPMLKFSKKVNGTYYVVEAIPESKHKKFWVVSAYMQKADSGTQALDANGPETTPKASLASSLSTSDTNVPQAAPGVNNQYTQEKTQVFAEQAENAVTADNLPAKANNVMKRAENAVLRTMEKQLHLTRTDHLPEIVRAATEEYLRTGDLSQETAESLFAQMWNEGTSSEDTTDPFFEECAKAEFSDAMAKLRLELRDVKRYAEDRQQQLAKEETSDLTLADIRTMYPKLKDARKRYERAQAKNLLTAEDSAMVNRILRGDAELEGLDPQKYNVKGIRAVYEAKREYEDYAKQIRKWNQTRKAGLRSKADNFLQTATAWKDKTKGILYSRETMERNILDIVPDAAMADAIVAEYFTPVHDAVADATRTKNAYRDRVRVMNLSTKISKADAAAGKVSEAHAVQLLGEAEDNIRMLERAKGRVTERDGKKLEDWKAVVENLWANNPQLDQAKIEGAVEEFRKIYDELFTQMNESRVRNGYEPINYRSGYFPHFQPGDGDGILTQFGKALGIETAVSALPTSINGLTHTFKPGITWMGNAQERLGFDTVYDAVEGFDKYIEGVADVIHLTDSIQNLRAFASQIRYRTTDDGIREQVDKIRTDERLTAQEKEEMIQNIYNDPNTKYALGNFVVELDEYINLLANKKSRADRNMEQALGRDAYNAVKALESRVAANMVAVNPASWLTNFIPLTQGWAGVSTKHMLQGMQDTLKAVKTDDGIVGQSSFLTNRRGSDPLVQTWTQKTSATLSKPMSWIDSFTAGSLVRARYNQNIERGMSEAAAMEEADGWVAGVMADRSKGSTPTLFNRSNPITKLFTQFQLEVNNQLGYMFKDVPRDMKDKGVAALAGALLKFALGAFLFDEIYEYLIGRRPALDPIGILNDTVGDLTGYKLPNLIEGTVNAIQGEGFFEKKEPAGVSQSIKNLTSNVVGELPFTSVLSMAGIDIDQGRIPVSSALPDLGTLTDALTNSEWDAKKRWKEGLEEVAKPVTYLLPPFGGGQLKKVGQGIAATTMGGSYSVNAAGEDLLQYPVYNDTVGEKAKSLIQSSLFGKTTLPEAREWIESGFKTLNASETETYKNMTAAGISDRDAWEWINTIKAAGKQTDKLKTIGDLDVSEETAKELFGMVMGTDMETEQGNATAYAKLLDAMNTALGVQEVVELKNSGADLDRFLGYTDAGMDAGAAYDLSLAAVEMRKKENIEGTFNIKENARWIESAGLTKSQQEIAWLATYPEWAEKADKAGVSNWDYITYKKVTYGLTKKDEKKKALRDAGYTATEAAQIYDRIN